MDSSGKLLVVDGSRVVRATLKKRLSAHFSIIEESDGESAWQTLMLDTSICAVISGAQPPRLEACDLLARMRTSSKRHLRALPVVLIVSDVEHHEHRERDEAAGITAFITKTMSASAMRETLDQVIAESTPQDSTPTVLGKEVFRRRLEKSPGTKESSLLVFSLDARAALQTRFGEPALTRIDSHLSTLIASRLSADDVLGQTGTDRLALFAPGVNASESARFARQICKSLAQGQITVRGETIGLTLSVGIAHSLTDQTNDPQTLLNLAATRADEASQQGGNTVVEPAPDHAPPDWAVVSSWLTSDIDRASLARLAPDIYPFLATIDRELNLGLPLAEIDRRLRQFATETRL